MLTDDCDADYRWDEKAFPRNAQYSVVVMDGWMDGLVDVRWKHMKMSGQGYLKGLIAALA